MHVRSVSKVNTPEKSARQIITSLHDIHVMIETKIYLKYLGKKYISTENTLVYIQLAV